MRNVDGHPDRVHPRHDVLPEWCQAAIADIANHFASGPEAVFRVIGQLCQALAHLIECVDVIDIAEMICVLHAEDDADLPGCGGASQIRASIDAEEALGMPVDEAVP